MSARRISEAIRGGKPGRRLFGKLTTGLAAALLFVCLCAAAPDRAQGAPRTKTLMIYMCGSNLETSYGSATADYLEMLEAGAEDGVTVLVMMGGSRGWDLGLNPEETQIVRLDGKGARTVRSTESLNMGDGETLAGFLQWSREHAPAEEYALILWDHGGGPVGGVCWDELYGADHLTLEEMTAALEKGGFRERKLSWIGFDACLMSTAEVGSALAPYAEYMISSQAEEPASGWNYSFLRGLSGDADGLETGRRIVDAYFAGREDSAADLTLACVDLSRMEELTAALDELFSALSEELTRESFSEISRMRIRATSFGRAGEIQPGECGYDLVDLASLARSYEERKPEAAARTLRAAEEAVVCRRSNVKDSCGLSLYHPYRNVGKFREEWQEAYAGIRFCPGYTRYVTLYGGIMAGERLALWNDLNRLTVQKDSGADEAEVSAELTENQMNNLASARLMILGRSLYDSVDDAYFLLYSSGEVTAEGNRITGRYDYSHLQAMSENGTQPLSGALSYRVTENGTWIVPMTPFRLDGSRSSETVLAEYLPDETGVLRLKNYLVYDGMTGTYSSRAEVRLDEYDGVTFLNEYRNPTVNGAGEMLPFSRWTADAHAENQFRSRQDMDRTRFQMRLTRDLVRAEEMYAAFELTDTQGNAYMTQLTPLVGGKAGFCPMRVWSGESLLTPGSSENIEIPVTGTDGEEMAMIRFGMAALVPAEAAENGRILVNMQLENCSRAELSCMLSDVRLNGTLTEAGALAGSGTGAGYSAAKKLLAPGESSTANLILRRTDLKPLFPEVSLREIGMELTVFTVEAGEIRTLGVYPIRLETEIPLTLFYANTDRLPSAAARDFSGAEQWDPAGKLLFDGLDVRVGLKGLYMVDGAMVLQIRAENRSGKTATVALGNAALEGLPAATGLWSNVCAQVKNNQIETFRLDLPKWEARSAGLLELAAGETAEDYLLIRPGEGQPGTVQEITVEAWIYRNGEAWQPIWFSPAKIRTADTFSLAAGAESAAPEADCGVTPGEDRPAEEPRPLPKTFAAEAGAEPATLRLPAEAKADHGYYVLMRRYRAEEDLIRQDILNETNPDTGDPALSFRDGQEWLSIEAEGLLTPEADGSFSGRYPGMVPALLSGGTATPLSPVTIQEDGEGRLIYRRFNGFLDFESDAFAGVPTGRIIRGAEWVYDPASGEGTLTECDETQGKYPSIAEMVSQTVYLIEADAEEAEMLSFLNDMQMDQHKLRQYRLLEEGNFFFGLVPAEDYEVVLVYRDTEGTLHCTGPRPLTDFQ